ncbi:YciI family protein [Actinokineospora inagensis]|uniref:YciI family protein n=1 Tax=Actinokineospora inagensis TaxID=103730 RepID=UPI00041FC221|nr:YciI family protein [Actinokineospora inagensis]
MTWFTVDTRYVEDADLLAAVRPQHRDYLQSMVETGQVLAAGPWADDSGGFLVIKAADRAELDALLAVDPYTVDGVAAERVIREWKIVLGQPAALA